MLNVLGPATRYCDGVSRRSFLSLGSLAVGGLSMADLARANVGSKHKAVIMVYLSGGLSHQDTFDLKPQAPVEIRGEFKPIATNVTGIEFCELLPNLAKIADKLAVVRSVMGQTDEHSSFQSLTGHTMGIAQRDRLPNFGSVVSKVLGRTDPVTPAFVDLFPTMQHRPYNSTGAGYLGASHDQVRADGEDLACMKLRYIDAPTFNDRQGLLRSLDGVRRRLDGAGLDGMNESYRRAFEVLTSSKIVEALDVEREAPAVRERYGRGSSKHVGDGAPLWNDQLLIARRLVEAGVRVVTVAYGFWDTHGGNFSHLRQHLPMFDKGISALIGDLSERGLNEDVSLVVWGEFGRTPKINANAGRDHWAPVQSALFAGGGMHVGQVVGATDGQGAFAKTNPIHFRDVLATIYHRLGIDSHQLVRDTSERPVMILPEEATPIRALVA